MHSEGDAVASVSPQLSVRRGREAVAFYEQAFGAVEIYRVGGSDEHPSVVSQLAVGESSFWVSDESPEHRHFSPETLGGSTLRLLLVVDEPQAVVAQAVALGASEVHPVVRAHGWLLGRIEDPFGHHWEIGKPLGEWPPRHPGRLETERLWLEPLEPGHATEMAAVLADPELHRYTGGRPLVVDELRRRYEHQARGRSDDGRARWLNWIVRDKSTGGAVGYVQATVAEASASADVAWVVGVPFQGRGYAREAAAAMLSRLRDEGVTTVTAHIRPDNAPSERVARALGLAPTATRVDGEVRWQRG